MLESISERVNVPPFSPLSHGVQSTSHTFVDTRFSNKLLPKILVNLTIVQALFRNNIPCEATPRLKGLAHTPARWRRRKKSRTNRFSRGSCIGSSRAVTSARWRRCSTGCPCGWTCREAPGTYSPWTATGSSTSTSSRTAPPTSSPATSPSRYVLYLRQSAESRAPASGSVGLLSRAGSCEEGRGESRSLHRPEAFYTSIAFVCRVCSFDWRVAWRWFGASRARGWRWRHFCLGSWILLTDKGSDTPLSWRWYFSGILFSIKSRP